jgi:hypothetical protein
VHRFGSSLNRHGHFDHYILDDVFEPREDGGIRLLRASAVTAAEIASIGVQLRRRVLRWFACNGLLDADGARDLLARDTGSF